MTNDLARAKVSSAIQGAEVIEERTFEGGGCRVVMRIAMFGASNSLASAVMPAPKKREAFPKPIQSVAPSMPACDDQTSVGARIEMINRQSEPTVSKDNKAIGGYTGLIVDCRALNLTPVMSPMIKNAAGKLIYGHKNLNAERVIADGMASCTTDPTNGTLRAGGNPLVVKAISLDDHNVNPILSTADANRILIENKASGFLDQTKVVFVY